MTPYDLRIAEHADQVVITFVSDGTYHSDSDTMQVRLRVRLHE